MQVTEAIKEAKGAKTEAVVELEKGADTVVRTHTPPAAWIAPVMCLCTRIPQVPVANRARHKPL